MPINLPKGSIVCSPTSGAHYKVVTDDPIGGGQGKGYFVQDEAGRDLFLKMFLEPTRLSREAAEFVLRQQALGKKLREIPDFVCQDIEFFELAGTFYKVQERMRGAPLSERLQQAAAPAHQRDPDFWPEADRQTNAAVLAYAVAEIHDHGLVHLDLKPDNCYLDRRTIASTGKTPLIARLLDFDSGWVEGTPKPRPMGTANYQSPEHEDPGKFGPLGKHSDVFSLGIILYQLLARRYPFVALRGHLTRAADPPRSVASWLPESVADAIWAALDPRAANRPTAREVHQAVIRRSTPVAAPAPSGARPVMPATPKPAAPAAASLPPVPIARPAVPDTPVAVPTRLALLAAGRRIRFWKDTPLGRDTLRGLPGYEDVDREQATIARRGAEWTVVACAGAAHPACLNGTILSPGATQVLHEGDELRIGRLIVRVVFECES